MKLLILVQTEADVSGLTAAANAILNTAITGVWVVFSPAITVNASEAAAKLDADIAQLRAAERQSAERADYEAAAGYKLQREGKELDRAKALRDAWKTASAEDRQAKTREIFGPFLALLKPNGLNVKITSHSDHYDREQWVAMLNSLSGAWFKEFSPGSFVVAWPESVASSVKIGAIPQEMPATPAPEPTAEQKAKYEEQVKSRLPKVPPMTLSRTDELKSLRTFALYAEAKKVNVDPKGKSKEAIVAEILQAEGKPMEAAAMAEY